MNATSPLLTSSLVNHAFNLIRLAQNSTALTAGSNIFVGLSLDSLTSRRRFTNLQRFRSTTSSSLNRFRVARSDDVEDEVEIGVVEVSQTSSIWLAVGWNIDFLFKLPDTTMVFFDSKTKVLFNRRVQTKVGSVVVVVRLNISSTSSLVGLLSAPRSLKTSSEPQVQLNSDSDVKSRT
ncbi:hypothetical protein DFH06DRAFT_1342159 [Mycena polygramma]|nr:hypothetical protein DFH06DRAFT_1342159 [Mycena polygramma]